MKLNKASLFFIALLLILIVFFDLFDVIKRNEQKTKENIQKTSHIFAHSKNHTLSSLPTDPNKSYDYHLKNDRYGQNINASLDYYMLALSWSPSFCSKKKKNKKPYFNPDIQYQCDIQKKSAWVIHGLWAQNKKAKKITEHPRFCKGDLPKVDQSILVHYLDHSPGFSLLQGQWEKHGSCIFQTADEYFQKQQELYQKLSLPAQKMKHKKLISWLKKHNPQLKNKYIKTNKNEIFICYDLSFNIINCPKKY